MPRPKRADEAGGIYHALNRCNARGEFFQKDGDYEAFERILAKAADRYPCKILAYQLMPNHWHFVLQPEVDGAMSDFLRWASLTHTMRLHAHRGSLGQGHLYQGRFKSFPVQDDDHFLTVCRYVERNALRAGLVAHADDWRWGSLNRWLNKPEREPRLLSDWPIPRPPRWRARVNDALSVAELQAIRRCVSRGSPYGASEWSAATARRLGLDSTLRPRGRPKRASSGGESC